ncbi:MAG: transketolase [Candidatus Riflebacteria bacterium]|nr:transketolase [Candidatus Riflebacteria bacterium]
MSCFSGADKMRLPADQIVEIADRMRAYALIAIYNANSGHPGGSLSAMDLIAALYFDKLKHDPSNPGWPDRDRFFLSKAHACPALYAALASTGYCSVEDMMSFRELHSRFQGHPDMRRLNGVEFSGGSLGQGLGVAVGSALAGKIKGQDYNVFCLMGDGEQQEGSIWEAAMSASNFGLDNLIGIIDRNHLQIDGSTEDVMKLEELSSKYKSFGWNVIEIDGHNMEKILCAYEKAIAFKGKPSVIIAQTIKGKNVSFMENNHKWHSTAPDYDQLSAALSELQQKKSDLEKYIRRPFPAGYYPNTDHGSSLYKWNSHDTMRVEMATTRQAFGRILAKTNDLAILKLSADSCNSIFGTEFENFDFSKKKGVINFGIAEQNMTNVAGGLAKEGFIPFIGSYGIFACGRNWDQLRSSVCLPNFNVKIAGVGGLTVGKDGASHQALEEIFLTTCLPNMKVVVPCDSFETGKATQEAINAEGPLYIRLGKSKIPIVTKSETKFVLGKANIIRFRKAQKMFSDSFDTFLSEDYESENESLAIFACGIMVAEAMLAAYVLKSEWGIETRIVNMHTIKPLDKKIVVRSAQEIEHVIVAEEHQSGGLGNLVAAEILKAGNLRTKSFFIVGVNDEFGQSGSPETLVKHYKLNAEEIVKRAKISLNL